MTFPTKDREDRLARVEYPYLGLYCTWLPWLQISTDAILQSWDFDNCWRFRRAFIRVEGVQLLGGLTLRMVQRCQVWLFSYSVCPARHFVVESPALHAWEQR